MIYNEKLQKKEKKKKPIPVGFFMFMFLGWVFCCQPCLQMSLSYWQEIVFFWKGLIFADLFLSNKFKKNIYIKIVRNKKKKTEAIKKVNSVIIPKFALYAFSMLIALSCNRETYEITINHHYHGTYNYVWKETKAQ